MTEQEMLDCLQNVWKNMTMDKDRHAYSEMLTLLDDMHYFLRYDLQCDAMPSQLEVQAGEFTF